MVLKKIHNAKLIIVGDGPLKAELIELSKSLGIDNCVEFTGYQKNPYKYLASGDVYVLGSRNEGFPNVLIEALACDLPVVAVDCLSGPCEILSEKYDFKRIQGIKYDKYGVLVEESDQETELIKNLSTAMISMAIDKSKLDRYKAVAYQRASQFSFETYLDKIMKTIN